MSWRLTDAISSVKYPRRILTLQRSFPSRSSRLATREMPRSRDDKKIKHQSIQPSSIDATDDGSNTTTIVSQLTRRRILASWSLRRRPSPFYRRLLHGRGHHPAFIVAPRRSRNNQNTLVCGKIAPSDHNQITLDPSMVDPTLNEACKRWYQPKKVSIINYIMQLHRKNIVTSRN